MDLGVVIRYSIRSGEQCSCGTGHQSAMSPHIGAHITVNHGPKSQERTVLAGGHFKLAAIFAGMIRRHQMFAAVFDPFNWLSQLYRSERDQKILRIKFPADAKPAANVIFDKVNSTLWKLQERRDGLPVKMRQLGDAPNGELPFAAIERSDETPCLQRVAGEAMNAKFLSAGVLGISESTINVTDGEFMHRSEIRAGSFMDQHFVS